MNTNTKPEAAAETINNVKEETVMTNSNTKVNDEMANYQAGVLAPGYGYYNQQFGAQGGYDPNFVALQGQPYTQYQDPNPQPSYFGGAGFYGAPMNYAAGGATMVTKPTSVVKGANYITDEQVQGIKDSISSESWRVDSVQSWQAGCTHKKRKGADAGLPSGHEVEGGAPGAWHCDECMLDWILTDCDADTFDQIVEFMFNVVNTDKIKCSNIPQSLAEGVFAGIPILKLLGKFHRYAEKDYANAKANNAATFNPTMAYGSPFAGMGMGFNNGMPYANPWQPQPQMAPMGGYPGAPQYPYPQPVPQAGFQQPAAPTTYGSNPYAAAPAANPMINPNAPAAPVAPAAPAAPAPAAPVAAPAAPTPYTPSNTAATAPDVTKQAGVI